MKIKSFFAVFCLLFLTASCASNPNADDDIGTITHVRALEAQDGNAVNYATAGAMTGQGSGGSPGGQLVGIAAGTIIGGAIDLARNHDLATRYKAVEYTIHLRSGRTVKVTQHILKEKEALQPKDTVFIDSTGKDLEVVPYKGSLK